MLRCKNRDGEREVDRQAGWQTYRQARRLIETDIERDKQGGCFRQRDK